MVVVASLNSNLVVDVIDPWFVAVLSLLTFRVVAMIVGVGGGGGRRRLMWTFSLILP